MERYRNARIFVLDDDQDFCQTLADVLASWGMEPVCVGHPAVAVRKLKEKPFQVVLLDVHLSDVSGLDLIPQIREDCPDSKIIIMTGMADKQTAISAVRLGAFDFLEKPFQQEILHHSVGRALDARSKELSLKKAIDDLQRSHSEINTQKEQLEQLNRQLMDTNRALSTFAQNIEREREETQKSMAMNVKSLIIPLIEKLRRDAALSKYRPELDLLASQIMDDFTSGFATDARIVLALSFTELRIASMIKNGLSTPEIAEQLHISISTVRTHRRNIRKKLKLNNGPCSLRSFLLAKVGADSTGNNGSTHR